MTYNLWIHSRILGPWLQKMVSVLCNSIPGYMAIGASLQNIWKSHSIPISTKIWLMKALVWPVAIYGCESWILRNNEETRLDAFEMKCWERFCGFCGQRRKQTSAFLTMWCKEWIEHMNTNLETVRHCENKEVSILWSHHKETKELPGERDNARNNARCMQARKTMHSLDGQHQYVNRTPRGRVNQNDRGPR